MYGKEKDMENKTVIQSSPPMYAHDCTYRIVSLVAYLIGVPHKFFEDGSGNLQGDVYLSLEKDKNARIIRNLCRLRTAIERNFRNINNKMRYEYKTLYGMPDLVPAECISQLEGDGVFVIKNSSVKLYQHIVVINRLVSERVNNCRGLFPLWINWEYIKDIFIMPDGYTEEGTAAAAAVYYGKRQYYPYQMYINWIPEDEGNILFNDKKFVMLLYQRHGDSFTDISKVSDAGGVIKNGVYDFLQNSTKTVMVVDCENSDPYKLCAALRGLDSEAVRKITKIILFDDVHTAPAWKMLETFTRIPVEHHLIERVKQEKSLVDIQLTAGACREHYQNHVDSFIIASSDSDYWGLISSLPDADFLLLVEREKCGYSMKNALTSSHIFYCYMDDFYTGGGSEMQTSALIKAVHHYLDSLFQLNVNDMMEEVYRVTRVNMSEAEKRQFYEKYVKPMHLVIDKNGNVTIELKK